MSIVDKTIVEELNVLEWFDDVMTTMDDNSVPSEGRILYCTPKLVKIIKNAEGINRNITVTAPTNINRTVHSLDDVRINSVPSSRLKTAYDFTQGCVPAAGAGQINAILVHPSCVISRDKYSYIKVWSPESDSRTADKYIYQNRYYTDTFLEALSDGKPTYTVGA